MTQSRYFDQLIMNQIEPKLFWRVYRLCWSQSQPQMCQVLQNDTTAVVSPERNQVQICDSDVGNGFYGSCTVYWQIDKSNESPNTGRKTSSDKKPWFWIFYDQMKFNWHQNSNTSHTEHAKHVCKVRCPKCANVTQSRLCHLEGFCNFFLQITSRPPLESLGTVLK